MTEKRKPLLDLALVGDSNKGFNEISGLPSRMERYSSAKKRQLQILNHLGGLSQEEKADLTLHSLLDFKKLNQQLCSCGNYLVFHQYYTVDKVRLAKARFCKNHLLCQLCAIRRGAKQVGSYMDRLDVVMSGNKNLKPYMLTLTVKNGHDLPERFDHLQLSVKKMLSRRRDFISKSRGFSELAKAEGGVYSYELTKSKKTGWHPHVHMVLMVDPKKPMDFPFDSRPKNHNHEEWKSLTPGQKKNEKDKWKKWGELAKKSELSQEWSRITGDSEIVDLRPIEGDPAEGFVEVFKYALKFSDLTPEENVESYSYLKGKRLTGAFGSFWGVKVPDKLTDELLEDLPYVELFYKYTKAGYSLETAIPKKANEKREHEVIIPEFTDVSSVQKSSQKLSPENDNLDIQNRLSLANKFRLERYHRGTLERKKMNYVSFEPNNFKEDLSLKYCIENGVSITKARLYVFENFIGQRFKKRENKDADGEA